jgi:hypothetical protein
VVDMAVSQNHRRNLARVEARGALHSSRRHYRS